MLEYSSGCLSSPVNYSNHAIKHSQGNVGSCAINTRQVEHKIQFKENRKCVDHLIAIFP